MSRYINADRVHRDCEMRFADTGVPYEWSYALTIIDNAPTADVVPVVHARWLTWEEQFPGKIPKKKSRLGLFCSACHNYSDNIYDYCPNCGARMDADTQEREGGK